MSTENELLLGFLGSNERLEMSFRVVGSTSGTLLHNNLVLYVLKLPGDGF